MLFIIAKGNVIIYVVEENQEAKAPVVITAFHCPKTDGTFCPVFTGITAG